MASGPGAGVHGGRDGGQLAQAVPGGGRAITGRASAAAGSLAAEAAVGYWHPALGAALAAADVVIPAAIALVLLTAILRGSAETCERAFRLLRWIADRPEPHAPPGRRAGG